MAGDHLAPPPAPGADPDGRLATIAAPVLDRLAATLDDTRSTVVLTDAHAGILDRRAGTRRLYDLLDVVGLVPGYSYAEDVVGTNGMGTAAEERRAVRVSGEEHYTEALRDLTCVGVPILHPVTGRLEGVLDLTCFNEDAGAWMSPLVSEAVAGVQSLLEEQATVTERALLGAFLRASHRATGAVVSLNDSFVLTNPAAARLLDGADHGRLWEIGAETVGAGHAPEREILLAGGSMVRASFELVEVGDRPVGAVVRLAEVDEERTAPSRRRLTGSTTNPAPSRAPASGSVARWAAEVARAVDDGERVLVQGPAGAGKFTVTRLALTEDGAPRTSTTEFAGPTGPTGPTVLDAGRVAVDGVRGWLTAAEVALGSGRVVVIRHVDVLPDDAATGLAAVLDGASAAARIVATATEHVGATTSEAAQALVDRFGRLVRVPGLGERADELGGLVRSILARLVPTGAVRCAPEVVQALGRVDLPGNVRQLEAVLHRVVVRRRVGTITLDDLPAEIRAGTHRPHLTAMEQHECEAITRALADADGNKAAAAAALGISRSTMYRKLEAYGLQLDRRTW